MKNFRSNIPTILGIASLTMVASLALLAPQGASAVDEPAKTADTLRKIKPEIAVPKLAEDECTITIKTDKESYVAGDKPVITVEVVNNSKNAVDKSIEVSMSGRDVFERSRIPAKPSVLWKDTRDVSVAAGETKTITFETDTALLDNQAISLSLGRTGNAVEKVVRIG